MPVYMTCRNTAKYLLSTDQLLYFTLNVQVQVHRERHTGRLTLSHFFCSLQDVSLLCYPSSSEAYRPSHVMSKFRTCTREPIPDTLLNVLTSQA
jgi:hypothetical protein